MKYIYYPEYELEYRNLLGKGHTTNHILNIRLLMFLCDHVILPPSHLLYTNSENILALISHLQAFFDAGKIVTTRYPRGIDDYFDSRIESIPDSATKFKKTVQANEIKSNLLYNQNVEHNQSDEKAQLTFFDDRLRSLMSDTQKYKKKSILVIDRMQALSDTTGEPVYSNQFKNILTDLLQRQDITKKHYQYFLNLMSNAYYYSGTYTMNTLVSYNSYFETIGLQNSLSDSRTQATNFIVDPHFLQKLFEAIGIHVQDINRLGVAEYQEIMSHKNWKAFMDIFNTLYTSAQELEELLTYRKTLLKNYGKKSLAISKSLDFIVNDIMPELISFPVHPFIGVGVSVVISALRKFFPPIERTELFINNYACDKILYLMNRNKDPLYEFSYRLNAIIRRLK